MKAIVNSTICPLMLEPTAECELADEALLGMTVEVLGEVRDGWCRVRTHYRYEGWASEYDLVFDPDRVTIWGSAPKLVVLRGYCTVLSKPDVRGWEIGALTRGAIVVPLEAPNEDGWQHIALPDGRRGYTKSGFLGTYHTTPVSDDEETLRAHIVAAAQPYMGAHYRWGGKSPLGIDCSGLTSMAYLLNGIAIYRDARIVEGFPVRAIARENIKKGDLLYFPGHVALYLGDGDFIHSTGFNGSDGVVINSLNPASPRYRRDLAEGEITVGSIF